MRIASSLTVVLSIAGTLVTGCGPSMQECGRGADCAPDADTPCSYGDTEVCGADEVTYPNACVAFASGTTIDEFGPCVVITACGGSINEGCLTGDFCEYGPDQSCGSGDQTGTCRDIPVVCTDEVDPVCGCDDVTYGNACAAAAASTSIKHTGACDCLPPPCAPPPEGCHYEGSTPCACGMLVCADGQR